VERLDKDVVALAHRIEGVEHGYECGADSNEGAFGLVKAVDRVGCLMGSLLTCQSVLRP